MGIRRSLSKCHSGLTSSSESINTDCVSPTASGGTLAGVASPTTLAAAFGVGAGHTTARCANNWAAICSASRAATLVSAGSSKLACPVIKSVTRRQTVGHNEGSTAKWRPKLSRVICLTLPSIRSLLTNR